mmetsp:Transcript_21431/g.36578  ORF Transcript_21431/g.36578 Transcript_21431/m.36578 type:complete len:202 (-) Transcript_21431:314-919(-)|eukprot:CAMPEP_0119105720 /NCGR_PEP_ID=MMETSP1180-20130426/3610_1 /TAXON_ID=3052 ORGANISM="Chlamydomonas cf sp, Strain CCMP681" /NCGR_SAMPLE_ID=MMETSP1180 /ASSEMBLY_ACC=CAM_ASM_000741 /LENGTH=201 /DNA_ID=CAMNT_0007090851 /DNA_START=175 /DNA_END=780 /DNA_ORIENTATION=-
MAGGDSSGRLSEEPCNQLDTFLTLLGPLADAHKEDVHRLRKRLTTLIDVHGRRTSGREGGEGGSAVQVGHHATPPVMSWVRFRDQVGVVVAVVSDAHVLTGQVTSMPRVVWGVQGVDREVWEDVSDLDQLSIILPAHLLTGCIEKAQQSLNGIISPRVPGRREGPGNLGGSARHPELAQAICAHSEAAWNSAGLERPVPWL